MTKCHLRSDIYLFYYLTWDSGQVRWCLNKSYYVLKLRVATFFYINITSQARLITAGTSLIRDPFFLIFNYKQPKRESMSCPKCQGTHWDKHLRLNISPSVVCSSFVLLLHGASGNASSINKKKKNLFAIRSHFWFSPSHTVGTKRVCPHAHHMIVLYTRGSQFGAIPFDDTLEMRMTPSRNVRHHRGESRSRKSISKHFK